MKGKNKVKIVHILEVKAESYSRLACIYIVQRFTWPFNFVPGNGNAIM